MKNDCPFHNMLLFSDLNEHFIILIPTKCYVILVVNNTQSMKEHHMLVQGTTHKNTDTSMGKATRVMSITFQL
jgi:hypothetical protein